MNTTDEMQRKSFPIEIKQATDRTFSVVISTGTTDRDGDTIDPTGWDLRAYQANPVVLWQHNKELPPIARAVDVRVQGHKLVAVMEFPPHGVSALADEIHGLMEAGFLHSTSVGFLPLRSTPNGKGLTFHEAQLLEFSIVNIPSNVEARVLRCAGESCNELAMKSWLGRSGGDRTLEIVPSPSYTIAQEAGRLAEENVRRRIGKAARFTMPDDMVLEIIDTYDVDEQALAVGVAATCVGLVAAEASTQVRKQINYLRGKVE